MPLYNEQLSSTNSIFVFDGDANGGDYYFLNKIDIENASPFSLGLDVEDPSDVLTKDNFMSLFDHFDCYINCNNQIISTRNDHETKCYKFGKNKNGKPWWSIFTDGGYEGGTFIIFIHGSYLDVGFPGSGGRVNYPLEILSGGSNGPLNPTFQDAIWLLQMDCEADEDDIDGAGLGGIENGLIEDDVVNPTAIAIYEKWCYFKKKCMSDDFSGYQPLVPPIFHNSNHWENPYYQVGQFFSENSELFAEMLDLGYDCVSVDDLELMKCISDKYDNFIKTYDIALTASEEKAIKKAVMDSEECGDEFEDLLECMGSFDDHIIIDPSFSDCEAYNCMLEHLRSNGNTHLCNMIGHIIDSDSYTIKFETGFVAGDGSTKISDIENKEITVKFHYADCDIENVDQLAIAETLLHESQHANFYAELFELGLEEYTSEAVKEKWLEYVNENCDVQYADQHQAMVQNYMELAATYLWELNNKVLTPQHYMKYVWDGLSHVWEGAYTPATIASWENMYKELNGIEPYIVNQNSFSCQ